MVRTAAFVAILLLAKPALADDKDTAVTQAANYIYLRDVCKAPEMNDPKLKDVFIRVLGAIQKEGWQDALIAHQWRFEQAAKGTPPADVCRGLVAAYGAK